MTTPHDDDAAAPLLRSVPAGSPADAAMRESLRTLRDAAPTPEQRRLYDDILSGRRSARDLLRDPGFGAMATEGFRQYEERRAEMTDAERAALDETAERAFDEDAPPTV